MALTAAAVPLWMHLSLVEECRVRVEQALAALAGSSDPNERLEMRLCAAQGALLIIASGAEAHDSARAWTRALALAERLDDAEYQLRALWGLWAFTSTAIRIASRWGGRKVPRGRRSGRLRRPALGQRMIGLSLFLRGDLAGAQDRLERACRYIASDERSHTIRFQFDLRVSARVFIAWILWLRVRTGVRAAKWPSRMPARSIIPLALLRPRRWRMSTAFLTGDLTRRTVRISNRSFDPALARCGAEGRAYRVCC